MLEEDVLLGAVADDLTGASDLALMLAREGMKTLQVVGVPAGDADFGDAEAVVVSLKSRTAPVGEAVAQSVASAQSLLAAGARQLFFKYCSTFDSTETGNIGPVADALLDLVGEKLTIACPAFPANKRSVYMGHLFVGDVLLSDSPMRDHPLTPMRDASLVRLLRPQTRHAVPLVSFPTVEAGAEAIAAALVGMEGIAVVDAVSDRHLRSIGRAVRHFRLVTGGSGVAIGLPQNFRELGLIGEARAPEPIRAPDGRTVVIAGSCSAATLGQIEAARQASAPMRQVLPADLAAGRVTAQELVDWVLAQPEGAAPVLYSSAPPEAVKASQRTLGVSGAGAMIETLFGEVARQLADAGFTRIIVAGGETSGAVVAALGVTALRIGPEIAPGVPWTLAEGGGRRLALALKSGNFGGPDFFARAEGMPA